MTDTVFLQPLDVLYLRGNKLFGDAGSYGEAMMPPWPSLAAGAIRSRMMADANADFGSFAQGQRLGDDALHQTLGTPAAPGTFAIRQFRVARRLPSGSVEACCPWIEACYPLPADVIVQETANQVVVHTLKPRALASGISSSATTLQVPVIAESERTKAKAGYWLVEAGWSAYLSGLPLTEKHLIKTADLWKTDSRIGIALNETSRSAADRALFTADAVALHKNVGFMVSVDGAEGGLPVGGLVRLGGDGRAASVQRVDYTTTKPDLEAIDETKRFKLVLTTPGIFPGGWKLPGLGDDHIWRFNGVEAKLISAAVPRAEVISGWDLVTNQPKPAQRVAPTGSVYWFENFQGDAAALGKLSETGLWGFPDQTTDAQRRAEGFNNVAIGLWK